MFHDPWSIIPPNSIDSDGNVIFIAFVILFLIGLAFMYVINKPFMYKPVSELIPLKKKRKIKNH